MYTKIFKQGLQIILILTLIVLIIHWTLRQLGFPMLDYEYNTFYNLVHNRTITTETYKVNMPFLTWRIVKESPENIKLNGLLTKKRNLNAIFKKNFINKDIEFIKNMCQAPKILLYKNSLKEYDIYCDKAHLSLKSFEPFRIYWVKDKVFLFMPNYDNNFKKEYDNLISYIHVK